MSDKNNHNLLIHKSMRFVVRRAVGNNIRVEGERASTLSRRGPRGTLLGFNFT